MNTSQQSVSLSKLEAAIEEFAANSRQEKEVWSLRFHISEAQRYLKAGNFPAAAVVVELIGRHCSQLDSLAKETIDCLKNPLGPLH